MRWLSRIEGEDGKSYSSANSIVGSYTATIKDDLGNVCRLPLQECKSDILGVVRDNYYAVTDMLVRLLEVTDGLERCRDFNPESVWGGSALLYSVEDLFPMDDLCIFYMSKSQMKPYSLLDLYCVLYNSSFNLQDYEVYVKMAVGYYKVDINADLLAFLSKYRVLKGDTTIKV